MRRKIFVILLLSIVIFAALLNFSFVPYNVLRPVYVDTIMKTGAIGMSYLGGALLIGMLIGGILIGIIGKKVKPIKTVVISFSVIGLSYALLGLIAYLDMTHTFKMLAIIVVSMCFGMCIPIAQAPISAMIMKRIPSDIMGRVLSIFTLISLSTTPMGGAFVGLIGDRLTVPQLFIIMGIVDIIGAAIFMIYHKVKASDLDNPVKASA